MDKLFGTAYTCLEAKTGLALLRQHMDDSGEVIYISLLNYFFTYIYKLIIVCMAVTKEVLISHE